VLAAIFLLQKRFGGVGDFPQKSPASISATKYATVSVENFGEEKLPQTRRKNAKMVTA
jgi:hypothetical protein